ncbi:MAG: response regulator transcription factor [Ferruginibacter sp.]
MIKDQEIISLLIVDDHQMVRDGIRVMLESLDSRFLFKITETENGEEAVKKVMHNHFDIVLIDYQLPGMSGAETIEKILSIRPHARVLALSNYDEVTYVNSMMQSGAKGYVLKNIEPAELLNAIKTVLGGKPFYSNEVAVKLLENEKKLPRTNQPGAYGLTKMQVVVLRMIAQEMNNEEIAASLHIAKRTVDTHRQNLLMKLNAKNTAGLVKAAYQLKLI